MSVKFTRINYHKKMKTEVDYKNKREEVLSKFSEEFAKEFYTYDAVFRNISEMLIRDADPYAIIEQLVIDRKKLIEQMGILAVHSTVPIIYPQK